MSFIITFLEGIISFISPCMLPMLPIYISYFGGGVDAENRKKQTVVFRATAFVLGFTLVFILLGVFAGTIGKLLSTYKTIVNIVSGVIVVLFGLSYLNVFRLPFFKGMKTERTISSFFSALVFGMVYSVSLTPCVGAFLGSALMLASSTGGALQGAILLFIYSLGLGTPFVLSAILLDKLSGAFSWIKKNYKIINIVCGAFLIIIGLIMAFGLMNSIYLLFI